MWFIGILEYWNLDFLSPSGIDYSSKKECPQHKWRIRPAVIEMQASHARFEVPLGGFRGEDGNVVNYEL